MIDYRSKLNRLLADYNHTRRQVKDEKVALEQAKQRYEHTLQAQKIVQEVAEATQQHAHKQIAGVVSKCLQAVFGDEAYEFTIKFTQKRGKTEAELLLMRGGEGIDPCDAAGGGVVDMVAFALRLSCLVLSTPKHRKLLVLDEPWKHLSAQYRPAVRQLVLTLAKEMGVQFLIVTHSAEFRMGKVVEIE